MSDREAFVAAIAANPHDDLPRLVFADWLEEQGDGERGAFIRAQIAYKAPGQSQRELTALSSAADDAFDAAGMRWADELFRAHGVPTSEFHIEPACRWWRQKPDGETVRSNGGPCVTLNLTPKANASHAVGDITYERGFVSRANLPPLSSLVRPALADAFRLEPISALALEFDADATGGQWAKLSDPSLRRVGDLTVGFATTGAAALSALFADVHLAGVRKFSLEPDRWFDGTVMPAGVVAEFARSPLAYRLSALHLMGLDRDGMRAVCRSGRLSVEELTVRGVELNQSLGALGGSPTAATVRRLDLSACGVGDSAVARLAADWWPKLTELELVGNHITGAGLRPLAEARFVGRLEVLNLFGNPLDSPEERLGQAGLRTLAAALNPRVLRRLNLSSTGLQAVPDFLGERFGERVTV
jgi:uncharacterized protein (TIGR02996 family)